MTKYLTLCGLLIIGFETCTSPNKKQKEDLSQVLDGFKSDYDTLQVLDLPLILNRKTWSELVQKHYDRFGARGGYDLLTMPFAKVFESQLFKGIIFIYDNPILITIDRNHNPVDTLFLLGDDYSNDPSIRTVERASVNTDFTMQLIDSIFTYKVENEQSRIDSSEKLTIAISNFRIDKTGKIIKIE